MSEIEHCRCCSVGRHLKGPHHLVVTGAPEATQAPTLCEAWALILCVLEAADGKWLQMSAIRDVLRRPPSTVANLIRAAKLAGIVEHRYEKCPRGHRHLMVRLPQEVEK